MPGDGGTDPLKSVSTGQPASAAQGQRGLWQRRRACVVNPRQALQKALRDGAELATPVAETLDGLDTLLASTQFAALFCRAPLTHSDAAVAFVGLDSRVCDSGQKPGRRRLSKCGPSELRRLLYNCAQAAAKTVTWKPYYTTLRSRILSDSSLDDLS